MYLRMRPMLRCYGCDEHGLPNQLLTTLESGLPSKVVYNPVCSGYRSDKLGCTRYLSNYTWVPRYTAGQPHDSHIFTIYTSTSRLPLRSTSLKAEPTHPTPRHAASQPRYTPRKRRKNWDRPNRGTAAVIDASARNIPFTASWEIATARLLVARPMVVLAIRGREACGLDVACGSE
jgi:hypothetical protein